MSDFVPVRDLSSILATNYVLYTKTQNFHWNVVGPYFHTLHEMFEEQYTELAESNDVIAERIRSLGAFAPGTHVEFNELSLIKEQPNQISAEAMVGELLSDHETLIERLKVLIPLYAESGDDGTADLLTSRCESHQKIAWMLRSFLG